MDRKELVERLAAEIQRLSAVGDSDRARTLAALQQVVVARMRRDTVAEQSGDAAPVPRPRPVPPPEDARWLGERHQLQLLRWHWGTFYEIALGSEWTAKRRDSGEVLVADSAGGLRHRIHEDFAVRPVPRQSLR